MRGILQVSVVLAFAASTAQAGDLAVIVHGGDHLTVEHAITNHGGHPGLRLGQNMVAAKVPPPFLAALQADPDVWLVEEDYEVHTMLTPNDTYYGLEYGLNNTGQPVNGTIGSSDADIDAPEAWNITTGSTKTVVADIDTGIDYNHPDLYLNIWINQGEIPTAIRVNLTDVDGDALITFWDLNNSVNHGPGKITDLNGDGRIDGGDLLNNSSGWENGVDDDGDSKIDDLIGWNFVSNTNDPLDDNGHGSHTGGTMAAIGNNGIGVTGVNWKGQIAAMKFLAANGSGAISGAQGGLDLSVAKGILISNNSWGGGGFSQSFFNSLVGANNAGHVFVAAAGNSGANNDLTASYPSNYNAANVVAVAATNNKDQMASFSNYGTTTVDIAAPGVSIASTYSNGGYVYLDGTSMATPHVTGTVALIRSQDPTLSAVSTISRVLNGADVISGLTSRVAGGRRLNAFNAVNVGVEDTTPPAVTSAVANGTVAVSSVRLTFSEALDAASFTVDDITNASGLTAIAVVPVGVGSTQFDVTFSPVTTAGTYGFTVGPDITDVAGNPMATEYTASFAVTGDTAGARVTSAVANSSTALSSVRLTFSEAIDANSFTVAEITNASPSLTNLAVVVVTSTVFDVTFDPVTTPGSYSFTVGPDVLDLAGNPMNQNNNGISGEPDDTYTASFTVVVPVTTFTNNTAVALKDVGTTTSTITINQDMSIKDLNVSVNLTHTWDSDLIITLRSPAGVTVTLANRRGGSGDNYSNTLFDDEAATSIANGVAPFSGSYRPEGLLSGFDNANARGTWTLSIRDAAKFDVGTLRSWSVTVAQ